MTEDKPFYFRLDRWICQQKNKTGIRWIYSQWGNWDKELWMSFSQKCTIQEVPKLFAIKEGDRESAILALCYS